MRAAARHSMAVSARKVRWQPIRSFFDAAAYFAQYDICAAIHTVAAPSLLARRSRPRQRLTLSKAAMDAALGGTRGSGCHHLARTSIGLPPSVTQEPAASGDRVRVLPRFATATISHHPTSVPLLEMSVDRGGERQQLWGCHAHPLSPQVYLILPCP